MSTRLGSCAPSLRSMIVPCGHRGRCRWPMRDSGIRILHTHHTPPRGRAVTVHSTAALMSDVLYCVRWTNTKTRVRVVLGGVCLVIFLAPSGGARFPRGEAGTVT